MVKLDRDSRGGWESNEQGEYCIYNRMWRTKQNGFSWRSERWKWSFKWKEKEHGKQETSAKIDLLLLVYITNKKEEEITGYQLLQEQQTTYNEKKK